MERPSFDFMGMTKREIAKNQSEKQQAAITPESPAKAPIRDYLSQNQDLLAWEQTQDKLSSLSHIFKWIAEDPGMARRLQILADRCKRHATQAEHGGFIESKREYLTILGELCALYYVQFPEWDVKEIVNSRVGKRVVYLAISEEAFQKHIPELPPDAVCILVREIPAWIVANETQRQDMIQTKSVFPSAIVVSA